MTKILVIITSGKNEIDKALAGMGFAYNSKVNKYLDDIKIIFFGPSEELIASENENVQDMIKKLKEAGMDMTACRSVSDRLQVTAKISNLGINVDFIGKIIANHIRQGYVPMTF